MSAFMTLKRFLKLNRFQDSSCIMVSQSITNILLLIYILDAISTVKFRPLEPHLLTVSGARHFVAPKESDSDSDSVGVTNDENNENTKSRTRVTIRDSSIKLWDLSANSGH